VIPYLKSLLQEVPKPIGSLLSKIPYRLQPVIGPIYTLHQKEIASFDSKDIVSQKSFVLAKIQNVLRHAAQVPFYRNLYAFCGVKPEDVSSFSDFEKLPIVTKEMLRAVPLEQRSAKALGRYTTNTGGSSGSTLTFYITPNLIPNEWAHMHTIWSKLGYEQSMLKMTYGGRNLAGKSIVYDGLRNQFSVNVYKGFKSILKELRTTLKREKVYYLHGYPSALAEFATNCDQHAPDLVRILRRTLRGAFLGSEFPALVYRNRIESVFGIPTVSWYGHTERAILAWEKKEKFVYHPFQTYGYCEVIPNDDTGGWKLIGTSYGNFASPFIRYDTGDDVEPIEVEDGLLLSFRIRSGRLGEFVVDRHGTKIPLTALIFGRHHRLFDIAAFIQVRQDVTGAMTVIVTPKEKFLSGIFFDNWFDNAGLDMKITFQVVEKPILSASGKVKLKVT